MSESRDERVTSVLDKKSLVEAGAGVGGGGAKFNDRFLRYQRPVSYEGYIRMTNRSPVFCSSYASHYLRSGLRKMKSNELLNTEPR